MSADKYQKYYVPAQSPWPIIGAIGLFMIAVGAGVTVQQYANGGSGGAYLLLAGIAVILFMLMGWFRHVIYESMAGLYSPQMDRSFRQGMSWFIFSEVMFFAAFFGALFYARSIALPWLAGEGNNAMTHAVLWPNFVDNWPLLITPAGQTTQAMPWDGIPLVNTILLLTSSVTLHFAHVSLEQSKRTALKLWLGLTIILGLSFISGQIYEYYHAYHALNLTLDAGIYGNTFFLLTGFHGMHVILGMIFLCVLLARILKGHFTHEHHFAFQAGSWYWHFVDVVWLCLFVFVYIL
ncbi:cytochrome c oxidase subunit 3 [Shewanella sp. NIFS-20-20]|uniref:cytochrome c oxidase subunit 3 n=1 Tax=Shewanella sp. NIFS-20-20 TaxID=2853806 RepID=UPI001C459BAF|nr:cytochrome c oxidase subunit 3 [Shewanella sp. NIFS-20-20]MBV7316932.1 cytochrome c oxidase subunit 3 [Shewanella sp. NIFS-20-20]